MVIAVLIALSALAAAQESNFINDPTDCLNTVVTLSSCTTMLQNAQTCFDTDNSNSQAGCYCQQSVLDYIAGCHQQMWDCFPTSAIDNMFLGTTGLYYDWSTICEEVFTFSPTTMMVTKPPAFDQELCLSIAMECESLTVSMTSCNSAYSTADADLSNCLCNDDMLYYGSRCDIDFNERCLRRTWDPTAVYSNKVCGGTTRTGPISQPSLTSSSTASQLVPTSSYVPPVPSLTAETGVVPTAATGDGMAWRAVGKGLSGGGFAFIVAVSLA